MPWSIASFARVKTCSTGLPARFGPLIVELEGNCLYSLTPDSNSRQWAPDSLEIIYMGYNVFVRNLPNIVFYMIFFKSSAVLTIHLGKLVPQF